MFKQNISLKALFPLILFLFLGGTACGKTSSDISSKDSQTTEVSESMPIEEKSSVGVPKESLTDLVLALSVDGLLVINEQSGKTQTIPFNTDIATSQVAISSALGEPTESTQNSECPAGAMNFITWSNGLTMNVQQERFVGWTVRRDTESANLTTVDGVGLGKTLTELKANYSVEVIESTLGTEFYTSNNLFGLLSANEPNGVITNLWSGIACNFR